MVGYSALAVIGIGGFNAVNGIRRYTTAYPAKAEIMPALKQFLIWPDKQAIF
mgnify:CR=1 FL=1